MRAGPWWRSPIWRKAPFVLAGHRSALVAVTFATSLVALAASSAPLVTTAAASAALKHKLVELSPLSTGLEIKEQLDPTASPDSAGADATRRRQGAQALAERLHLGRPVFTEESGLPLSFATPTGDVQVTLMARTGALGHVHVLARAPGAGVWISDLTARTAGVRPGESLRLQYAVQGASRSAMVRVKGIYSDLDRSDPGPFWSNFLSEIFLPGPDPPPPSRYVFMSSARLRRLVHFFAGAGSFRNRSPVYALETGPDLEAITELPVDPHGLTLARARVLATQFTALARGSRSSTLVIDRVCPPGRGTRTIMNGRSSRCTVSSALSAAVALADENAAEIAPLVSLLSDVGTLIALGVAGVSAVFLVQRRRAEVALYFTRGERVVTFAARSATELTLPALAGAAGGFGLALSLTGLFAPSGSVDGGTIRAAAAHAGLAGAVGLALATGVTTVLFTRLLESRDSRLHRLRWLPWELPVLGAALWLLQDVLSGGGVAQSGSSTVGHPTLAVFALPLLLVAAVAGLATRAVTAVLRRHVSRESRLPAALFLAARRLAAAGGVLTALLVVAAVSFGAYFYAETLATSLSRSVNEKAYVAYGGDAQGIVSDSAVVPHRLRYPLTTVQYGSRAATLDGTDGPLADVLAVDPTTLGAVVRWFRDWGPDPRSFYDELSSGSGSLPVIVTRSAPTPLRAIWIQGVRIPVRVLARVGAFPGMSAGAPLVVVSRRTLETTAARAHALDPLGVSQTYAWAKGPPRAASNVLRGSVGASYVTNVDTFRRRPDVRLAARIFSYMRVLAAASGALVLLGLLLYLQARQRSQAVASALSARMGLRRRTEILSLSLELAAIALLAAVLGGAVSISAAAPIIGHLDPLPNNPPAPAIAVPFVALGVTAICLVAIGLVTAVLTSWLSRRTDMSEALRVA